MADDLRWVLLGIGVLIILWVMWDASRTARGEKEKNKDKPVGRKEPVFVPDREEAPVADVVPEAVTGREDVRSEKPLNSGVSESAPTLPETPELVVTINVMADIDNEFPGESLLRCLLTLGCKYGDLNIFHRTASGDGQGEHWFSVANAFQPGTFDLTAMGQQTFLGISLFMVLPGPGKPTEVFEHMLRAAQSLQAELGGHLEDGQHSSLTTQSIAHYRELVLEYERHQLARKPL
jgi:cell division protein ZipA